MSTLQEPTTGEDPETERADAVEAAVETRADEASAARRLGTHRPDHWRLAGGGALLAAGAGILLEEPSLLLVTVVVVGMLAVRQRSTPPDPTVSVSRSLSPEQPEPGETVEVETTITNSGKRLLPDCRFVDLVPDELRVVAGSPRLATRLEPGEKCTLRYEIETASGNHRFDGVYAVFSDRTATREHEYELPATRTLVCRYYPDPLQVPALRTATTPYAGRLATDNSGEGVEFHAVREYRTGDPLRRIDWNQYASSRELATLQFRTERSAAVVLLVDVRDDAYTRSGPEDSHAADRGIEAASRLLVTLLDEDHRVGIATLGPDFWLPPGDSDTHRTRALDALATEPAFSSRPPSRSHPIRLRTLQLLHRLTGTTQILLCTPLVDDQVEVSIQLLESAGHEVTVISPDPTEMGGRGSIVATLDRQQRIDRIHGYGVPVIDWALDASLDVAVARTMKGWSR